jgi:hypothetical protein
MKFKQINNFRSPKSQLGNMKTTSHLPNLISTNLLYSLVFFFNTAASCKVSIVLQLQSRNYYYNSCENIFKFLKFVRQVAKSGATYALTECTSVVTPTPRQLCSFPESQRK